MQGPNLGAVPVMPNASLVTGTIQSAAPPAQGQQHAVLVLFIQTAEDIDDLANFCTEEVGSSIQVNLRTEEPDSDLPEPGTEIQLRVEFRGDERGGGYYAHVENMTVHL